MKCFPAPGALLQFPDLFAVWAAPAYPVPPAAGRISAADLPADNAGSDNPLSAAAAWQPQCPSLFSL